MKASSSALKLGKVPSVEDSVRPLQPSNLTSQTCMRLFFPLLFFKHVNKFKDRKETYAFF